MSNVQPPSFFKALLDRMFPASYMEEIEGDLREDFYYNLERKGRTKARLKYAFDVLALYRLYLRTNRQKHKPHSMNMLFYNHFKFGLRSIYRQKFYQLLNTLALTLGFSCFALIFLFIYNQKHLDNFLESPESIVRLSTYTPEKEGSGIHIGLPILLKEELPEIEGYSFLSSTVAKVETPETPEAFEETITYANEDFLNIFELKLLVGRNFNPELNEILISHHVAEKLFSKIDVVGENVSITIKENTSDYTVSGIIENVPVNSSFSANIVRPIKTNTTYSNLDSKVMLSQLAYFRLAKGTNKEALAEKIPETLKPHTTNESLLSAKYIFRELREVKSDIRISDNYIASVDGQVMTIFSVVGLVVLALTVANYVNLSAAIALKKTQEMCVKKVMGASKKNLIFQQLIESSIVCFVALLFTLAIVFYLITPIENYIGLKLQLTTTSALNVIGLIGITLFGLTVLGALYPAIILSNIKLSEYLKGKTIHSPKSKLVRNGLLLIQFSISSFLIVGSLTFVKQLHFINKSHHINQAGEVLIVSGQIGKESKAIKHELLALPEVDLVTVTTLAPGPGYNKRGSIGLPDFEKQFDFHIVDVDFVEVMGLEVTEGVNFYKDGRHSKYHALANETFATITDENVVGMRFKAFGEEETMVIGIVKDFPIGSMKSKIEPAIFLLETMSSSVNKAAIKLETGDLKSALDKIEGVWHNVLPDEPFNAEFLDDRIQRIYTSELKMGQIFGIFTTVAIVISCLGIFGLLTYLVQVKMKEIGIRKVLGANLLSLTKLLTSNIWKILTLSSCLAFPLSYYFLKDWLASFAYQTSINASLFIGTLLVFAVIIMFTVLFQIRKVSKLNPSDVLRNE